MKNVLLLKGGGSTEHEVSLISAKYIESKIDSAKFNVFSVEIDLNFQWKIDGSNCELNSQRFLIFDQKKIKIDVAIPCIHGYPGETGDIQSFFELINLPYLGCNPETSVLCFNKLVTKLFLEASGVKTSPFIQVNSDSKLDDALVFLDNHKVVYVKATNQGSSVGCYRVTNRDELPQAIKSAFKYSPFVIIEKAIIGRELEVSVFEYNNQFCITKPGEVICPKDFYSYEEKYSKESNTQTFVEAPQITDTTFQEIKKQANIAIQRLKLRHLSRIDFFLTSDDQVFINEINTFPGHTEISMFPTMMENYGVKYSEFLDGHLSSLS